MKLQYVSITGADDDVSVDDLNIIAGDYPFVEWATLLMPEKMGEKRFPSEQWIKNFTAHYEGTHKAAHLCGSAFLGFVDGDAAIIDLMTGFDRIQLNLEFGAVGGQYDPAQLITQIKAHPQFEFIIQYTDRHESLLPLLRDISHHAILFDQSAGRGVSPQNWPTPLDGHRCGYAGGLSPDNVQQNIEKIANICGDYETWIDMESGVRTNDDKFDLEKVRQVLSIAVPWAV